MKKNFQQLEAAFCRAGLPLVASQPTEETPGHDLQGCIEPKWCLQINHGAQHLVQSPQHNQLLTELLHNLWQCSEHCFWVRSTTSGTMARVVPLLCVLHLLGVRCTRLVCASLPRAASVASPRWRHAATSHRG